MRSMVWPLALLSAASHVLAVAHAAGDGAQIQIEYIAAELTGGVVKGAPYSADAVTETTQTLADGSRIVRKSTATVYRDSQGRMRREQTLGSVGPLAVQSGEPLRLVTISDPVAGVSYTLDPRTQTATKVPSAVVVQHLALPPDAQWVQHEEREDVFETALPAPAAQTAKRVIQTTVVRQTASGGQAQAEQLGKQIMEGVEVEGARQVTSIPAGQIGNERQIDTVFERWYSPRLQTVVMSRRSDPRTGETVYRLSNISLSEPPASLFQVPPGYVVREGSRGEDVLFIRKEQQ